MPADRAKLKGKRFYFGRTMSTVAIHDGLLYACDLGGNFVCLDAKTGEPLWHAYLGGPNASGPISYAVDGKQYIIGTGEGTMYSFALPD